MPEANKIDPQPAKQATVPVKAPNLPPLYIYFNKLNEHI